MCVGICLLRYVHVIPVWTISGKDNSRTVQTLSVQCSEAVVLAFPDRQVYTFEFQGFVSGKGGEETGGLYYVPTYSVFFFVRYNNNIGYFGFSN